MTGDDDLRGWVEAGGWKNAGEHPVPSDWIVEWTGNAGGLTFTQRGIDFSSETDWSGLFWRAPSNGDSPAGTDPLLLAPTVTAIDMADYKKIRTMGALSAADFRDDMIREFVSPNEVHCKPPRPRIIQAWDIPDGGLGVLGSDGRIWEGRAGVEGRIDWREVPNYPPGLDPKQGDPT